MTLTPFRGRCHTCGHDHDAEGQQLRDILDTIKPKAPTVTLPPPMFGSARHDGGEQVHGAFYSADEVVAVLRAAGVGVK